MRPRSAPMILALSLAALACSRDERAKPPVPAGAVAPVSPAASAEPSPPAEATPIASSGAAVSGPYEGHDYACDDGVSLHAKLEQGDVALTLDGQTTTLHPAPGSASARYEGGGITFIAEGGEATLLREGGKLLHCAAK